MRTSPDPRAYTTKDDWMRAMDAWGNALERESERRLLARMVGAHEHFKEETFELWELTETALKSPHVPWLREVLDMPNYETPQIYYEQLALHFLGVFVGDVAEDDAT